MSRDDEMNLQECGGYAAVLLTKLCLCVLCYEIVSSALCCNITRVSVLAAFGGQGGFIWMGQV